MQKARTGLACGALAIALAAVAGEAAAGEGKLDEAIAALKTPPPWFEGLAVRYDMSQPWQKARQHVRKLLAAHENREAMKISVLYHQQGRGSGNGHEHPMYLFRVAKPKYGRHLLPKRVAKVEAKLELLDRKTLDLGGVPDGVCRGQSLGYGSPLHASVRVQGGRIVEVQLSHKEKIEQRATAIVPRQIVERQSLEVDAITGATVTVQAVVEATYRALKRAGAK